MEQPTLTDPLGAFAWTLTDEPIQLREWGSDRIYPLPGSSTGDVDIGSSASCWLQLKDRHHLVSRRHATLSRSATGWVLRDAASKNGVWQDDERRMEVLLAAGVEVGIGGLRLVVESPRTIALRALLARLLGWGADRLVAVDRALRSVRVATTTRRPLLLCGDGDLAMIARRLHIETIGASWPFVVGLAARGRLTRDLDRAEGGTLCVWAKRKLSEVLCHAVESATRMRLVICARDFDDTLAIAGTPIYIPSLAQRSDELERIVDEFAADAIAQLDAKPTSFTPDDRHRILASFPRSLAEIGQTTLRYIAVREHGGVTRAAQRLGLSHVALSRWMYRRSSR